MEPFPTAFDELGVKVVPQDPFSGELELVLGKRLLELFVEIMELIVPENDGQC